MSAIEREARPWGYWYDIERTKDYRIKVMVVNPGARLSLQKHEHRTEAWTILEGSAVAKLNGSEFWLQTGESLTIPKGGVHRLSNRNEYPLVVLEVQRGVCEELDIIRLEDDFGRAVA